MKLLIAYVSHNGVSKRCAEMLADNLESTVSYELVDLEREEGVSVLGQDYDVIVLGGSVRYGRIDKRIRKILKELKKQPSPRDCALFICCGYSDRYEEYSETQLPRGFSPSLGVHHFGGELKPDGLRGVDKLVVKRMRSEINSLDFEDSDTSDRSLPEIIPENIVLLANTLNKLKK